MLGTIQVVDGDRLVDLGGPRQRRLLAALVLGDGRPVSTDVLVEAVFGEAASPRAADTLRSYVTRLRRALSGEPHQRPVSSSPRELIDRVGAGYRLRLDGLDVDAQRFSADIREARRHLQHGDPNAAVDAAEHALAMWRGDSYGDLADEPWVTAEAQRLDEARRSARELLADALLAAGRTEEAIGAVRDVLDADPYREGAVGRLMLALYRAGRPAEALATYREFDRRVGEDLGIDPGPTLARVHEQVLARDPALDRDAQRPSLRGYELRERLGRGRQGTVWAARMPGVDREYAVRVYDAAVADAPSTVASFDADVRLLVTMDEPALLPVYDGWREPGSAALVMRRMSGTLADRLARETLMPGTGAAIVQRVGRALIALARRGRRHGRVEPSSVMLDEAGQAYLAEPVLGAQDPDDGPGRRAIPDEADDARGFLRIAHACLADLPSDWWDGLNPDDLGTVDLVTDVLTRLEMPPPRPENPYVGLRPFEAADAHRYFGRDQLAGELVARVTDERLVLLVGGSGSGKSSIVRAGLVPRLRQMDPPWTTTMMVPGTRPMQHLSQALQRVATAGAAGPGDGGDGWDGERVALNLVEAARHASGRLLLVVDQLEELFTVADPDERERFLAVMAQIAGGLAGEVSLVATIRADYFDHPLDHPVFGEVAARASLAVPPMSAADLEQCVLGPAGTRLAVDEGLTAELVSAVVGQPGALPALQFTLRELADRGVTMLRRDDLIALGGVEGAIAHRAERMYTAMDLADQKVLRSVLQRLVVVDDTGEPARRSVPRSELASLASTADDLIEQWVDGRILTTGRRPDTREPTVTLAHEAVLSGWPRLRTWVDEDRERLLALARLTQSAQEWADLGQDTAALPRGGRLEQAENLTRTTVVPPVVAAFVASARALRAEEERQAADAAAAERRTARRLRRQRVLLAAALVVAIAVGWVAVDQRGAAIAAAEEQRRRADAGASSLVAASNEAALSDWSRALLLAAEAHRVSSSPQTQRHLIATLAQPRPVPTTVWTGLESLRAVVADPTTQWAAVQAVGGPVDVIDLAEGERIRGAQAQGQTGFDIHDGRLVFGDATVDGGRVRVLDDTGDRVVAALPVGVQVTDVEISPDGDQVAVADSSGVVRLLAMDSWEQTVTLSGQPDVAVQQVAWGDSAQALHAFDEAGGYLSWDLGAIAGVTTPLAPSTRRSTTARDALSSPEGPVDADLGVVDLQVLTDQRRLSVVSTRDGPFWVDIDTAEFEYLIGFWFGRGSPLGGAVTDDGGHVVVTGSLMEVHRPQSDPRDLRGTAVDVNAVDVDVRATDSAVTVGSDGNVTTWRLPDPAELPGAQRVPALDGARGVVAAADGRSLLVWSDATADVVDAATYAPRASLEVGPAGARVLGAAFVPGGDRVVVHTCPDAPEQEWQPCESVLTSYSLGGEMLTGPVDAGPAQLSAGASVVAGSDVLATADAMGSVAIRDPQTLELVEILRTPGAPDDVESSRLSLSPDGRILVLTTGQPETAAAWRLGTEPALLVTDVAGLSGVEAFDDFPEAYGAFAVSDELLLVATSDGIRTYASGGGDPLEVFPDPFERGDILASEVVRRSAINRGTRGLTTAVSSTTDSTLALTGEPGSYWLWDATQPLLLTGPIAVTMAELDPTGDRLWYWQQDGAAFVVSLQPDDLVTAACEAAGRTLTEQEWSRSIGAGEPYDPLCAA